MSDDDRLQPEPERDAEKEPENRPEEFEDEPDPRITLDHYYSRRRPPIKSGWGHIISLIAMLAALVMIMIYKDRCGQQVSELMGTMGPPDAGGTPVRYKLPEGQNQGK